MAYASRHQATVAAEARKLQKSLRAIGPLPRPVLARMTGADRWREGSFEEAVQEGVRQGTLKNLPLGWVEATRR